MSTYIPIGKLIGPHGLQGELLLQHQLGKRSTLSGVKAIFIEDKKGQFLPWFIEKAQARNEAETLLKIEGISSKEQAVKPSGWPKQILKNKQPKRPPSNYWVITS